MNEVKSQAHNLELFIISGSIGETVQRTIHTTLTQFPDLNSVEIEKFPCVKGEGEFLNILNLAKEHNATVATTLVSELFNALGHEFTREHDIPCVDYISDLINIVGRVTDEKPLIKSGTLRKLSEAYFKRTEVIEYSVKYDDGRHFSDIGGADALVIGVSHTPKTPLSMYLANEGYRITDIPLVPEAGIPDSVFKQKGLQIFGLTANPQYIANVRKSRAETLGLSEASQYNNLSRIKERLSYVEGVFKKLNATMINVEYKSIEGSVFCIGKFLQNDK